MSVHRFLSKRDKPRDSGSRLYHGFHTSSTSNVSNNTVMAVDPTSAIDFYGLFTEKAKPSNPEEQKIKTIKQRIVTSKSVLLKDSQILWALRCNFSNGDTDLAYELLLAMSNASEGIIIPYNPGVRLLGAVNRQAVTCFLDATLFAMFAHLDSFEAMLYNSFDDVPRNKLAFLLRLWVNLLRAGKLITTDITIFIQQALAGCGWDDAAELHQQDASEAFTFITEKLRLPLLTLKMDMFHAGKQDADDHRFINERLLEVAIPASEDGEPKDIKLEDCLEDYFNNRIEVRRFLERRSTIGSQRSFDAQSKGGAVHVETVELDSGASTPLTPIPSFVSPIRPVRARASSIIQERFVPNKSESAVTISTIGEDDTKSPVSRLRQGSLRKEVLMPAWQFFSLIPWYTDNAPSTDAQVAQHFSAKRPILGLCLKRYSMLPNGKAIRLNTYIDIPVEIRLPHFIQDDHMQDTGPVFGNFKLSLQAMVCHRGQSVDSGHYISLVRGTSHPGKDDSSDPWMRFDDLARERITVIDIQRGLREETPYLLFYRIMPVEGDPGNLTAGETIFPYEGSMHDSAVSGLSSSPERRRSTNESQPPSGRPSFEIPTPEENRGRTEADPRRPSVIFFSDYQLPLPKPPGVENGELNPRKSVSLGRSYSRSSLGLTKTFSGLTGVKPKEVQTSPAAVDPNIVVEVMEATPRSADVKLTETPVKAHKREKSKSRLTRGLGKHRDHKGEHPDRECSVM